MLHAAIIAWNPLLRILGAVEAGRHDGPARPRRSAGAVGNLTGMPWARWLSLAVVAVCLGGCGAHQVQAAARDQSGTFQFGGLIRTYKVHVPPGPPVEARPRRPAITSTTSGSLLRW